MSALPPLHKPLTQDAETSFTLPSEYYLSAEIFELEKQKIFYRTWQYVAHQSSLPNSGDYITLSI
ncbi:MAG: aromatic ring-hydroxylating dioxygenase subunit alpha, partial [Gammaproteobacteria bacterium]|nr:aromatic ring-hydroxylating dioxygenase subunit alpha [Gammaproteobacteria bacterium]